MIFDLVVLYDVLLEWAKSFALKTLGTSVVNLNRLLVSRVAVFRYKSWSRLASCLETCTD